MFGAQAKKNAQFSSKCGDDSENNEPRELYRSERGQTALFCCPKYHSHSAHLQMKLVFSGKIFSWILKIVHVKESREKSALKLSARWCRLGSVTSGPSCCFCCYSVFSGDLKSFGLGEVTEAGGCESLLGSTGLSWGLASVSPSGLTGLCLGSEHPALFSSFPTFLAFLGVSYPFLDHRKIFPH